MAKQGPSKKKPTSAQRAGFIAAGQPHDAAVILNLARFVAAGAGFCLLGNNATPELTISYAGDDGQGNPAVGPLAGTTNGFLVMKNTKVSVRINNMTGAGPYGFAGLAIVGVRRGGGGGRHPDPTGDVNFGALFWDENELIFRAKKVNLGARWKLYVAIADYSQNVPVIGLIDPDIENDAQPFMPRDR